MFSPYLLFVVFLVTAYCRRFAVAISLVLLSSGCASIPTDYVVPDSGEVYALPRVLAQIEESRIIFIGEGHMSMSDHLLQLAVIQNLHERGKKVTVALEMFPASAQPVLDRWLQASPDDEELYAAYEALWHVPYEYYEPIFLYAGRMGIPLTGINADRGLIAGVARQGLGYTDRDFLKRIGFTDCSLHPEYAAFLAGSEEIEGHGENLQYLCDAQRLRDTVMAYHVAHAFESRGGTIVVLVGAAHAARIAVPRILEENFALKSTVLITGDFRGIRGVVVSPDIADFLWY